MSEKAYTHVRCVNGDEFVGVPDDDTSTYLNMSDVTMIVSLGPPMRDRHVESVDLLCNVVAAIRHLGRTSIHTEQVVFSRDVKMPRWNSIHQCDLEE